MINVPDHILPKNAQGQEVCPRCGSTADKCACGQPSAVQTTHTGTSGPARIRIEKSGRRGKAVTVISELPAEDAWLKRVSRELRSMCACGGTYYVADGVGVIEVQGEHLEKVRGFLGESGIPYTG